MFPRNKRKAKPTEVGLMIRVLSTVLAESKNHSLKGDTKDKTQEIEDNLIQKFNQLELKVGGQLQHANSGGFRTYLSFFNQLGLTFEKTDFPSKSKTSLYLTIAGKELAELQDPASVVRRQVLRYQFPSPYSKLQNVDIDDSVVVKPTIFAIRMAQSRELGHICNVDIAIACIYGKNDRCLNQVINKCLEARKKYNDFSADKDLDNHEKRIKAIIAVLDEPYKDLYSKNTEKISKDTDYIEKRITDILDIGNTLINRLVSVGLLLKDINQKSIFLTDIFNFNKAHEDEFAREAKEQIVFPKDYKTVEGWQRRIGRGSQGKDTRSQIECRKFDLKDPEEHLKQETLKKYADSGTLFDINRYVKDFAKKMGKDEEYIRKLVETVLPKFETDISRQLNETGTDPKRYKEYEQNIAQLLRYYFPSATVKQIGTEKRLDKSKTQHNYSDILFHSNNYGFLQIDAKSTAKIYEYGANDVSKTEDYAKYPPKELFEDDHDQQRAFLVVTAAYSAGAKKRIQASEYRTGVPFRIFNTNEFVSLVQSTSSDDVLLVNHITN